MRGLFRLVGDDDRIVTTVGIGDIFVGLPIIVPLGAVDEVAKLIFAALVEIERHGEAAILLTLHRRRNFVLVIEIAHQKNAFILNGLRQRKRHFNHVFGFEELLFKHVTNPLICETYY